MSRLVGAIVILVLAVFPQGEPAWGKTVVVAQDGTGDVTAIQPAVTIAAPGDTIFIRSGEYLESNPFIVPGFSLETFVALTTDSLTFIGEDRDLVIIGPKVADFVDDCPKGFFALEPTTVRIENLTVRNVREGTNWEGGGSIKNCTFVGCDIGASFRATSPISVTGSLFQDLVDNSIFVASGSRKVLIEAATCFNVGSGIVVSGSTDIDIRSCSVDSARVGINFQQSAVGTVVGCIVRRCRNVSLVSTQNANLRVVDCQVGAGARVTCVVDSATIEIESSILGLGRENTVLFSGATASSIMRSDVHVEHPKSIWFQEGSYPSDPLTVMNLRDNYWALADSSSIADVIWDVGDDASIRAVAEFIPFRLKSTPVRQTSFGNLKRRF